MKNFFAYLDELYTIDFKYTELVPYLNSPHFGFKCLPKDIIKKKLKF